MRIVATADTHGYLPYIPPCDVLIVAGDVCPMNDHSVSFQRGWLETNFREWLQFVSADRVIGIGGNHDFALEKDEDLARSLPWTYLKDESVTIKGVKFYGMPWVPNLSRWAFHHDEPSLDAKFNAVPDDTDICIVHGPPYGICDFTVPQFGNVHTGTPQALDMMTRVRPKAFICGHIHEGFGAATFLPSNTVVANVAYRDETYTHVREPIWMSYEDPEFWVDQRQLPPWRKPRVIRDLSRLEY